MNRCRSMLLVPISQTLFTHTYRFWAAALNVYFSSVTRRTASRLKSSETTALRGRGCGCWGLYLIHCGFLSRVLFYPRRYPSILGYRKASLLRLVSTVLAEVDEEWQTGKSYLNIPPTDSCAENFLHKQCYFIKECKAKTQKSHNFDIEITAMQVVIEVTYSAVFSGVIFVSRSTSKSSNLPRFFHAVATRISLPKSSTTVLPSSVTRMGSVSISQRASE